MLYNLIMKI